jgi:putative NADH-flavin reductase
MKVTIFGATGRTGRHLVGQALEAGHEVVSFARTPTKLSIEDEKLSIVHGTVQDATRVREAVTGADAVLSVLGPTSNEPTYEVSQGMENILAAMQAQGVQRLVQSIGAGVGDPNDQPGLFDRAIKVLLRLMSRYVYEDMVRVADLIRASDLDWTLVRVPMLTDAPPSGDVLVGYLGRGVGARISRTDMAAFILEQASDDTYLRQAPVISN